MVSNVADAPGLAIAQREGVPTAVISHRGHPDRETFDRAVSAELERHGVKLVVLAGFLRIFSPWFPTRWANHLINIHPSLLPCFKGLHVQQQALDAGVRLSGCTVHFVIPDLDAGPIIAQAAVPVLADDTEETLSGFDAVLTLPGLAGFVLSIGIAVDAHVLIFERTRDEMRAGRSLAAAIEIGHERAWAAIRDGHMAAIITMVLLWWFGQQLGETRCGLIRVEKP